ncbi:MAG: cellulase family glycosylhydrolase [Cyclobacteriaceae bacterium]
MHRILTYSTSKALATWYVLFNACLLSAQTAHTGMRDITGLEIAAEMAPGVNLYNTLDAVCWWCDQHNGLESETVWGQPYTTPQMIEAIADRGFRSLRLPVTWFNHMGPAPDYIIDKEWMDRVEEVANYAFDNDLYVILNIHHDDLQADQQGSWLITTYEKQEEVSDQMAKVWTQIANRFIDYGDYLLFETMNEPREVGSPSEWNGGTQEHRDVVNALNLAAVNAIRATGGNNASRFIMTPQATASPQAAMSDLIIPNDDPNVIVSVHYYSPYRFCLEEPGTDTWGTENEKNTVRNDIKAISDHFVKKGRAVVLGEWGAIDKENLAARREYYKVLATACKAEGITPLAWFYSFDRNNLTWKYPELEDEILDAFNAEQPPVLGNLDVTGDLVIYPNPVSHQVNIDLPVQPSRILLYASSGQELMQWEPRGSALQLDMKAFDKGIYLLQIELGDEVITRKLIVEH